MPARKSGCGASLVVSPAQVRLGHAASLRWGVTGHEVPVASITLSSSGESGLYVIESAPAQGNRHIIFSRAGIFTFTLAVTFRDGIRCYRQVRVVVEA